MNIQGIDGVYLYTDGSAEDESIKTWLNTNEIEFTELRYADVTQHDQVLGAIQTWFPEEVVDHFPFVIYDEIYPKAVRNRCILLSSEILESNLPILNKIG